MHQNAATRTELKESGMGWPTTPRANPEQPGFERPPLGPGCFRFKRSRNPTTLPTDRRETPSDDGLRFAARKRHL